MNKAIDYPHIYEKSERFPVRMIAYSDFVEAMDRRAEEILDAVDNEFDLNHACNCLEWCDCWKNFKEKTKKR